MLHMRKLQLKEFKRHIQSHITSYIQSTLGPMSQTWLCIRSLVLSKGFIWRVPELANGDKGPLLHPSRQKPNVCFKFLVFHHHLSSWSNYKIKFKKRHS